MGNFINDRHALYVGWVLGIALQHDLPFSPVVDDDGNYTDRLLWEVSATLTIEVVVPEPPDGWMLG